MGLGQNRLAGKQGLSNRFSGVYGPKVMAVATIAKRYDEAGVGYSFHRRENLLREDKSGGPLIFPAWRRNVWLPFSDRALSSCWRIIRPTGRPVRRDTSFSQASSSSIRRIVSV
jgi:hypothetical protein